MSIELNVSGSLPAIEDYLTRKNYVHCANFLDSHYRQFYTNSWWSGYIIMLTSKRTVEMQYIPFFGYAPYRIQKSPGEFTWEIFCDAVEEAYTNYLKLVIEGPGAYEDYIRKHFSHLEYKSIVPYLYEDIPNKYSKKWIHSIFKQAQYGLDDDYNRGRIPQWVITDFHRSLNEEKLDYILKDKDLDIGVLSLLMDITPIQRFDAKASFIYKNEDVWRKDLDQRLQGSYLYNDLQYIVNRSLTTSYRFPGDINKELKRGILLGYL